MRRPPVLLAVLALLAPANLPAATPPAARDKQEAPGAELLEFLADFGADEDRAWLDRALAGIAVRGQRQEDENNPPTNEAEDHEEN